MTRFGPKFGTLSLDEKCFSITLISFTPYWDYKPTNVIHGDSRGVYTTDKILNLSTKYEIQLKCGVIDGGVVSGIRETILSSFI